MVINGEFLGYSIEYYDTGDRYQRRAWLNNKKSAHTLENRTLYPTLSDVSTAIEENNRYISHAHYMIYKEERGLVQSVAGEFNF